MYCVNCGEKLCNVQRFCSRCGFGVPEALAGSFATEPRGELPFFPIHQVISSHSTVVARFVLPAVWLAAGIAGAIWYLRIPGSERADSLGSAGVAAFVWLFLGIFILWTSSVLKKVTIDGRDLIVSNYFREARIPLNSIIRVHQDKWTRTQPVKIFFNLRTPFGRSISFIPAGYELPWKEHPIVAKLRWLSRVA